jgi:phosphohistidine phosphatase
MRIVLFRHGPSAARDATRWPDDALRPLTGPGERRTAAAARGLARIERGIGTVASSPLTRAQQTARRVAQACGLEDFETSDVLSPGASYRRVLDWLRQHEAGGDIVLVGHEPDLGKLAGTLIFGAPTWLPLKKAGACAIVIDDELQPGTGRLAWFMQPKLLRRWSAHKEKV